VCVCERERERESDQLGASLSSPSLAHEVMLAESPRHEPQSPLQERVRTTTPALQSVALHGTSAHGDHERLTPAKRF
jgi:hypothetical protein